MRFSVVVAALCAPSALSFPWLAPEGLDALLNHPEARAEIDRRLKEHQVDQAEKSHEPRQLKTGVVGGVVSLLGGTVEAVVDNVLGLIPTNKAVKGLQKFPESSHPFKAPGKTDQRGPCPGLNTLANHGYIPRNGIATIGQIQAGTAKLFNMGADLSALLAVGGAVDGGDILSQKMSIGGPDNRVGLLNGALNKIFGKPSGIAGHGKFNEGDASATREDFYLNGDNISFKSELFKQMHQQALAKGDGTYNVDAIKEHFKNRYRDSKAANKQFYFNLPSAAVVMGAYYFVPGFFSNGTIGAGGIANEASITSFYGAKPKRKNAWKDKDLEYTHVPERIPEQGWYRRATPMTIPEAVGGILDVYLYAQPALGGSGADGSWVVGPLDLPKDPQGLSCFLYNAIFANFPAELFNSVRLLQSILNGVSDALVPGYKALGCKVDFPDAKGSSASKKFAAYEKKYVGPAKTKAHTQNPFLPTLPIPGDPRNGAASSVSRSFRGNTFSSACRLWMIAQEVLGVYNFAKALISERVPLSFAELKYQKLLVWVDGLDDGMKRVEDCPYESIIFHHPKALYAASMNQLKELVFCFYAKYPQSAYTTFFNAAPPTLSLAMLEDLQGPSWRHYFYLCVRCWQDLYFSYPMFRDVAKAFLSMAMQKDAIAAGEAQNLLRGVDQTGEHHTTPEEAFTSFIFDFVSERVAEAQIHSMAGSRTRLLEQRLSRVLALLGDQAQGTPMSGFVAQIAAEDLDMNVLSGSRLDQLPLPRGLRLHGTVDVVDRGFLSLTEAQILLDNYRTKAVQHFPFVPISSGTTVASLRADKPFLFMCIMATMKFDNCTIQRQIGEEIRNQAHQRVLMQSESTLEILQGLLVYLAWYQYFFISYEKQQIVPIAQLCVSLVQNLGLDQNPDNMRRKVDLGPDETAPGRKAARSAEQLRALLGTYCTASWVSIKFRTRGALPYTGYIKQSWELLLANTEYPSDLMIPHFVRISEFCRRICDTFGYDDLENSGMRGEFVSAMALQTLNSESTLLKASIPPDLQNNLAIIMEVYLLDTLLGEVSLHDDFWDSKSTSNFSITNNPSSSTSTRASILFHLIRSCKSLNDAVIAYPDEELWYITFYTTAKICRSLLCLSNASKISSEIFRETGLALCNAPFMAISSPVHDAMTVERVADLKGEAKRLQGKFKNLSSQVQRIGKEEDIMLGFSSMIWAVAAAYEETKRLEPGLLNFSIGCDGQNSSSELGSSEGYLSSTGSGNLQPEAVLDFGMMEDETWEELLAGIATVTEPASSLQV
ncbi:hypothetical protein BFJ63_vAg5874 [Fusarium oxysporum f. sp. narcissi]|uniref:Heme haloperoxidase family profile domain-containing protein n=1 Tax=Fusarium oxysporum f. sp. narcissi TaxID=451672 RepID=A0A4Q2VWL4_FUSOX|nr:hypothetical protein BFJ63_vAg5874 [Fusarium oxysporum f. sp. narcissi]